MMAVLLKTKLGIIIRAGVENREVVQTLGYNINRIFTGVLPPGRPWPRWAAACGASSRSR